SRRSESRKSRSPRRSSTRSRRRSSSTGSTCAGCRPPTKACRPLSSSRPPPASGAGPTSRRPCRSTRGASPTSTRYPATPASTRSSPTAATASPAARARTPTSCCAEAGETEAKTNPMQYEIHAVDARQKVVGLTLEAASEAAAAEAARVRGLTVFSVRASRRLLRASRPGRFPTLLFSVELASLLEAGLNLVEALQTLGEKEAHGERHVVLAGLLAAIRRGEPFSQAIAAFPQHFPPLYAATVRAAERTGNVREALGRYIAYQEELERVKKKIVSAAIYPAI